MADRGLAATPDDAIRKYVAATGAVIITKDEDFSVLLVRIEAEFSAIVVALERGETLVEVV